MKFPDRFNPIHTLFLVMIPYFLSLSIAHAQVELSMALTDEDDEIIIDPELLCKEDVVGCLNIGVTQLVIIRVDNPQQSNITLDVSLFTKNLDTLWKAQPADITDQGWANDQQEFEILIDLTGINTSQRAWLSAKVLFLGSGGAGGPGNIIAQPNDQQNISDPGDNLAINDDLPNIQLWPFCLREYSRNAGECEPTSCPCRGDSWSPGVLAGFSIPSLPDPRMANDFAFNIQNKFAGITFSSPRKRIYYEFEALVSTLNFSDIVADSGIASTGRSDTLDYALVYFQISPIQVRARIGNLASLGAGAGIRYLAIADRDEIRVVSPEGTPPQNYQRWEPQVFADLRLGNSYRGLNFGLRFDMNLGQINQTKRTAYTQGKVYIHYGF